MDDQQQPLYTDEVVVWSEQLVVQKVSATLSIIGSYIIVREILAEELESTSRTTSTTTPRRRSSLIYQRDSGDISGTAAATTSTLAIDTKSNGSSGGNSGGTTTTTTSTKSLRRNSSSMISSNTIKNLKTKAISRILLSLSIGDICLSLGYFIGNVVSTDDILEAQDRNYGTSNMCTLQGFTFQFGLLSTGVFNIALSIL